MAVTRIDGGGIAAKVQPHQPVAKTDKSDNVSKQHTETSAGIMSKIGQTMFAGAVVGAKIAAKLAPVKDPQPPPSVKGLDSTFKQGSPTRPDIHHDNGFLQNPNGSTTPLPTRDPSIGDRLQLAKWKATLEAAEAAQGVPGVPHNNIPDALAAYRHFLEGDGKDRTFSYERYVQSDPAGKTTLKNATSDIQTAAEKQYQQMIERDPSLKNKPVTFQLTGSPIPAGNSKPKTLEEERIAQRYPYPQTENWQKAIGAHSIWTSGTVTVTPPTTPGGKPQFKMDMTLHAEDRYNFNPGAADIKTGIMDAENGRFEETGLARQYMNKATLDRTVTWSKGDIQNAASNPVDNSRQREPQDNRRARNRM